MRLTTSSSFGFSLFPKFALATTLAFLAGTGCAGIKGNTSSGTGGSTGKGGTGNTGDIIGTGGSSGPVQITPLSGNLSCADFNACPTGVTFDTGSEGTFNNNTSGSTTIAYPLTGSLFPYNLGPIQVQMTTPGTSARINFQTTSSNNVSVNFFGACESAPGNGCSVTLPLAFTQMLAPACQNEDIHITARVLSGTTPTGDSPAITADWALGRLTGGLYFWTVVPNPPQVAAGNTSNTPTPPNYILLDPPQAGSTTNGTQIERYDFSQDNPAPQVVWTDDGGPLSQPQAYDGAPQAWNSGKAGGHCVGCHTITNDGQFMALTIGGSSPTSGGNWELLNIKNQALELINPMGGGGLDTSSDANASPSSDPTNYWKSYRNENFAAETAWGPNSDVMVSMYNSQLYFNSVTVSGTSATVTRQGAAFPTSAAKIDPYQSDPFWSHDGSLFAFTSFNQTTTYGGTDGDVKLNGQIAIADATKETVTDNARVLVGRGNNLSNYYPCISEDSGYVVFNQSVCGAGNDPSPLGGGYGVGSCDGYDDASAELWWVSANGGATTRLDNANSIVNGNVVNYDNSWPRFSPDVGTFRGNKLYWIAFSSRRPYGVQANTGGLSTTQPQLWFTGVTVGEINVGDPSYAPVWLPGQNPMGNSTLYGNHVPQWVKVAIVIDPGI